MLLLQEVPGSGLNTGKLTTFFDSNCRGSDIFLLAKGKHTVNKYKCRQNIHIHKMKFYFKKETITRLTTKMLYSGPSGGGIS